MSEEIKTQHYLNISMIGHFVSDVEKIEVESPLIEIALEVLAEQRRAYGFRFSSRKYTIADGQKLFSEKEDKGAFFFLDPVYISEGSSPGVYIIDVKNNWAQFQCERGDRIIFTSEQSEKDFIVGCPLKTSSFWGLDQQEKSDQAIGNEIIVTAEAIEKITESVINGYMGN